MKVLWFEISPPSAYVAGGRPTGGWQDSLERIVKTIPDIELMIAFRSDIHTEIKIIDGVTYIPFSIKLSFYDRKFRNYWDVYIKKMLLEANKIIIKYNPDLIHVFGTEWCYGQIATITDIPLVTHIMGSILAINNVIYPPGYSYIEKLWQNFFFPRKFINICKLHKFNKQREIWERKTWTVVNNYMGRTNWDKSLSRIMNPCRQYFHVEEALRPSFLSPTRHWQYSNPQKIKLISTGCSNFWKGPDMMLKVAKILKKNNIDFVWNVAGRMNTETKKWVEKKEHARFEQYNINILGFISPDKLADLLCSSTMYVHTAYIENSPNSICEAQCLGVPVVSTNVGGIASLIRNDIDGILVPANDPWLMADSIIQLAADRETMQKYSENSRAIALKRHDDENIKEQLLQCYKKLVGIDI